MRNGWGLAFDWAGNAIEPGGFKLPPLVAQNIPFSAIIADFARFENESRANPSMKIRVIRMWLLTPGARYEDIAEAEREVVQIGLREGCWVFLFSEDGAAVANVENALRALLPRRDTATSRNAN